MSDPCKHIKQKIVYRVSGSCGKSYAVELWAFVHDVLLKSKQIIHEDIPKTALASHIYGVSRGYNFEAPPASWGCLLFESPVVTGSRLLPNSVPRLPPPSTPDAASRKLTQKHTHTSGSLPPLKRLRKRPPAPAQPPRHVPPHFPSWHAR